MIVGLASSVVLLTLPDSADTLRSEADRFATRLQRAQDEAILGTRAVQVSAGGSGYQFSRQRLEGWQPLDEGPFKKGTWAEGVRPVFEAGRTRTTFRFEPAGDATVESLVLEGNGNRLRVSVDEAARVVVETGAD